MAPYRRIALSQQARSPGDALRGVQRSGGRSIALIERGFDPHEAQPMMGLMVAVPLGLACWGALAGLAMLIGSLAS